MSILPIAIVVWAGVAILALVISRIGALIDEALPPFKEENLLQYGLFGVWLSAVVGLVVLFYQLW